MDLDMAIRAHAEWKIKLSSYISSPNGSLDPNEIEPDNLCPLGKWIYESIGKYATLPEFNELRISHAKFHQCAAKIVREANKGADLSAQLTLGSGSEYANLSTDIVKKIMAIKKEVS